MPDLDANSAPPATLPSPLADAPPLVAEAWAETPPDLTPSDSPSSPHPLDAALDRHFPDDPNHPDDSIYARTRRMFSAIITELTGRG